MTDEEHHARAMLMGMRYNRKARYYYKVVRKSDQPDISDRLDADTLEPVTLLEAIERMKDRI